MAREPQFVFKDQTFTAALVKLERNKVYGWTETKYTDAEGRPCSFITMLDDGRTMLGTGGLALKSIDSQGNEIDKSTLVARYDDGSEATLLPSVFDGETILDHTKTVQDYLDMDVKAVYQLKFAESSAALLSLLQEYKVLYFTFNYRASYDADDAFLVSQGDSIFAVIGTLTTFNYSTLELPTVLDDDGDDAGDDLDFNMF
ncbi:MAG: hypothetical protein IPK35_14075 [Saprospiraceae bacterium]|jgi:hypothetical protein|nr:hypothetical protein [Saprospiraceae bacterium]